MKRMSVKWHDRLIVALVVVAAVVVVIVYAVGLGFSEP